MILEILIFVLFAGIFVLLINGNPMKTNSNNKYEQCQPEPEERQQLCGTARVVKNKAVEFIHTGCSVDRKATFDHAVPGASPFGDDGFKWEQENALMGGGYELGNL